PREEILSFRFPENTQPCRGTRQSRATCGRQRQPSALPLFTSGPCFRGESCLGRSANAGLLFALKPAAALAVLQDVFAEGVKRVATAEHPFRRLLSKSQPLAIGGQPHEHPGVRLGLER